MIVNKYWSPNDLVLSQVESFCKLKDFDKILEVGPGERPFSLANYFVDVVERENSFQLDLDKDKFDLSDGYFDFAYTRHVFEDIQNPDFAFNELKRVSKFGFIETPSPLSECANGVDIHGIYRGYIHHRYIIWNEDGTIHFLPKYPIIEKISFNDTLIESYLEEPLYWNNYFLWDNNSKFVIYKNGFNFNIVSDYKDLLQRSIEKSIESTNKLFSINKPSNIKFL